MSLRSTRARWVNQWKRDNPELEKALSLVERARVAEMEGEIRKLRMGNEFSNEEADLLTFSNYIEGLYNREHLHSTLGYRTPKQARNDYRHVAAAAGSTKEINPSDYLQSLTQPNAPLGKCGTRHLVSALRVC